MPNQYKKLIIADFVNKESISKLAYYARISNTGVEFIKEFRDKSFVSFDNYRSDQINGVVELNKLLRPDYIDSTKQEFEEVKKRAIDFLNK